MVAKQTTSSPETDDSVNATCATRWGRAFESASTLVGQATGFKLMRVDLTADDADIHAELVLKAAEKLRNRAPTFKISPPPAAVGPISKSGGEIELKTGHRISISRFLRLHPSLTVHTL